jgi:hypothetical protein
VWACPVVPPWHLSRRRFDSDGDWLGAVAFYAGVAVTVIGFVVVRRKTRRWKVEYELASWRLSQTERKLHPAHARFKRMAKRMLLCLPSTIAAGVLFFFPAATHVVHPSSHYLRHYLVPIPWTFAVFPSPGGTDAYSSVAAFAGIVKSQLIFARSLDRRQLSSASVFGSVRGIRTLLRSTISGGNRSVQEPRRRSDENSC